MIRSDLVTELNLETVGQVNVKGIVGNAVCARLVRLPVQLCDAVLTTDEYVELIFAVCSELNETCILSIPAVNALNDKLNKKIVREMNVSSDMDLESSTYVVTRSQAKRLDATAVKTDDVIDSSSDDSFVDVDLTSQPIDKSVIGAASARDFAAEQQADVGLAPAWKLARRNKAGFIIKDDLLYHREQKCGREIEALCVPKNRQQNVLKLAHDGSHFGARHTKARIIMSGLWWPTLATDVQQWTAECNECQLRARRTFRDRVPIEGTRRDPQVFHYFFMDCAGPIIPNQNLRYNYFVILIDSCSRYPFAYPLKSLTAKHICNALMCMFEITGVPSGMVIASDNGSNFRAVLTRELMSRLGVSPVFATPYHPVAVVERSIQTLENTIAKMAYDQADNWVNYLGPSLWAMRSTVNETLGCPPHLLVFGSMPRGPLAILSETWSGKGNLPSELSKSAELYLQELRSKLEVAQNYATVCHDREQARHVKRYNLRAQRKQFVPGESCLVLQPVSTASHALRRWKGPAKVVRVLSPNSYLVLYDGCEFRMHANNLRKFHIRADEIRYESDLMPDGYEPNSNSEGLCACSIVYEDDIDFGELSVLEPQLCAVTEPLPSTKVPSEKLEHLSREQRIELLRVLDQFPEVFSEVPGLCTLAEHHVPILPGFQPKRLKAYKVPEQLKAEVSRQIKELLRLGIIEESTSPMASPIVCVLKRSTDKDGKRDVRIAVDYRYVNKFTEPSVAPLEDISEIIHKVGASNFISVFDAKSGFHQFPVAEQDRWLTSFICDDGQFHFLRTPFGMRSSSSTFVRGVKRALLPVRNVTKSYVDDMAVHSDTWYLHLQHIGRFLTAIRASG